jgi:hypothetical protein
MPCVNIIKIITSIGSDVETTILKGKDAAPGTFTSVGAAPMFLSLSISCIPDMELECYFYSECTRCIQLIAVS